MESIMIIPVMITGALMILMILSATLFTVEQQTCAIIERFGKFIRIAYPGLQFKIPIIDGIRARLSLRINQLDVNVETKTNDNVFINILVSVQYRVLERKIYEAFYMLQSPTHQIEAFVFDVVRAQVPKISLDDVFAKKDDIADAVKVELSEMMAEFGYEIVKALVTDIAPAANVKAAMNEINAAQRTRVAASEKGEAEKILKVKQAEAEAESSILHGKGLAGQRHAIVAGLKDSVEEFVKQVPGLTQKDVMETVLLIQYIDTLKEIAGTSKSNVIFVPSSPGNLASLADQIRESIIVGKSLEDKL
ncbi:MAG: SPFH domain-containing protein [Puniceicoccales bacterium]|jgi:regulator of protease activity HflC (stomatin/prohibitin superfamily)|nr:SPFH domain-containing protein [Puniceicoccales bacterium]